MGVARLPSGRTRYGDIMIFVTAADSNFKDYLDQLREALEFFGHELVVYDLNDLGEGERGFEVPDPNFICNGLYDREEDGSYASTGWHKPPIIQDFFKRFIKGTAHKGFGYIDAEAILQQDFEELNFKNFDLHVATRCEEDKKIEFTATSIEKRGDFNAGVLFFANNEVVEKLINDWVYVMPQVYSFIKSIGTANNDQKALSDLLKKNPQIMVNFLPEEFNQRKLNPNTIFLHLSGGKKNGKNFRPEDW
jgi:hypothetical protein